MLDPAGEKYAKVKYKYERNYFDPIVDLVRVERDEALAGGEGREDAPYEYDEEIILAVNAAMAANRPLLIAGPPGTGKSALAANISAQKGWAYEPEVITGRAEGRDLQWRYDAVQRLHDAHLAARPRRSDEPEARPDVDDVGSYIRPGVLWRAFDISKGGKGAGVVVLIDEIDKADPHVPNSLLEVLGTGHFKVTETGEEIERGDVAPLFVVITTNDERELSRPFRRRCVTLTLRPPNAARLMKVAERWNLTSGDDGVLAAELADQVEKLGPAPGGSGRLIPNAAEYLDALRTLLNLDIKAGSDDWEAVKRATLIKDLEPARVAP